jgi:geranylgeranyl diphosphate synthase type II
MARPAPAAPPSLDRAEAALEGALLAASVSPAPPGLARALRHSVIPGGARIRPTILIAVARACGEDRPALTDAAAAALELIHCASLVHDDLPCFDDAALRRGGASCHAAFGEPTAVLAGDSLIVAAFGVLARAGRHDAVRALRLTGILAERTGMPGGICAGQGWESEAEVDLSAYHQAKTGSLFVAATQMGAVAAGRDAEPWEPLGAAIGEAFQVADDLRDALMGEAELGKPAGQDAAHARPSAVAELGVEGAVARLRRILSGAVVAIPPCPGRDALAAMVHEQSSRLIPQGAPLPLAAE